MTAAKTKRNKSDRDDNEPLLSRSLLFRNIAVSPLAWPPPTNSEMRETGRDRKRRGGGSRSENEGSNEMTTFSKAMHEIEVRGWTVSGEDHSANGRSKRNHSAMSRIQLDQERMR